MTRIRPRRMLLWALLALLWAPGVQAQSQGDMNYPLVYENTSGSVVFIAAFIDETSGKQGTGFLLTSDGYLLTNRHVVWDETQNKPAGRMLVFLKPEKLTGRSADDLVHRLDARFIAASETLDLALLKIDSPKPLKPLIFAPKDGVRVGESTAAIGHPVGGVRWSLTTGRISGMSEDHGGVAGRAMIQMETPLNPGNSGGPLLNAAGQVVGVNTATVRKGSGDVVIEGINFAVNGDTARRWAESVLPAQATRKPQAATASAPLAPKKGQSVANPPDTRPGRVYGPDDLEKMLDQMIDDMQAEIEQRRKDMKPRGF